MQEQRGSLQLWRGLRPASVRDPGDSRGPGWAVSPTTFLETRTQRVWVCGVQPSFSRERTCVQGVAEPVGTP